MTSLSDTASDSSARQLGADRGNGTADMANEEQVVAYLVQNPDILTRHPQLLEVLAVPTRQYGDGVIDMQRFQIDHLKAQLQTLRRHHRKLVAAAEHNAVVEAQVRKATLCLLEASSFAELIAILRGDAAQALEVESVALLATAGDDDTLPKGLVPRSADELDALIQPDSRPVLRGRVSVEQARAVYGDDSGPAIKSDALVRLKPRADLPALVLALGAAREATFHPGQSSDLLQFLARVVEKCLALWWPTNQ